MGFGGWGWGFRVQGLGVRPPNVGLPRTEVELGAVAVVLAEDLAIQDSGFRVWG